MRLSPDCVRSLIEATIAQNHALVEILEGLESPERWISTAEAARMTGCTQDRIRYLAKTDQIRSRRRGKLFEVATGDLEDKQ